METVMEASEMHFLSYDVWHGQAICNMIRFTVRIGYPDKAEPSARRGRKVAVSMKMAELPKDIRRHVRLFFTGKRRKPYERQKRR